MKRSALAAALGAVALLTGASAQALRLPAARHCPVFPANNAWNQRVDKLPVSADSAQLISAIGLDAPVHADFGSGKWDGGPIGIPFDVVSQPDADPPRLVRVRRRVRPRPLSDPDARPHRGRRARDRRPARDPRRQEHVPALRAVRPAPQEATAGRPARAPSWNLRSNHLRPAGWTSADAAGLPIFPGLARWDEVARGGSTTRCASPRPRRGARTSIPRATTRRARTTRRCRRWGCACG